MQSIKEEFLQLLAAYQGILHKVNLVYFRSQADRDDNFQEMVYQLWKSYPKLQNKHSIGSWVYAVSINTSISRIKKERKIEYRDKLPDLPDQTGVFERIIQNEALKKLLDAISRLDEIDKSIMLLYLEERSYDEMAEIIGISKSNIGVRINRAKEKIKQLIQ
jgi:RNA polymerase sigma-70 factor (ECF subfamily)